MIQVAEIPGRTLISEGKEFLYFGGTAYLGLPSHPTFQDLLIHNIRRWGTAYGSSRNANVQLKAYGEGEQYLSQLAGTEAAITVSSGMLAGKLTIDTLTASSNRFFHFPGHHPAIHAVGSEPFCLDGNLHPALLNDVQEDITLLTDAVPSFQVQPVGLDDIGKISSAKRITLVIDESHSLGILGKNGGGIMGGLQLPNVYRKIQVASLGKAYALSGGMIASDREFIEKIQEFDCFVSGAGMNPAFAQTLFDAQPLYFGQRKKLMENLAYLGGLISGIGYMDFNTSYPVIYPHKENIHESLLQKDIVITHFKYPTSAKVLNRIVISAHHTHSDLERLALSLGS